MKTDKFIEEVENLTLGIWMLENSQKEPVMIHVKRDDVTMIACISEIKIAKFDFNGSLLSDEEWRRLLPLVVEYAMTPLEERR